MVLSKFAAVLHADRAIHGSSVKLDCLRSDCHQRKACNKIYMRWAFKIGRLEFIKLLGSADIVDMHRSEINEVKIFMPSLSDLDGDMEVLPVQLTGLQLDELGKAMLTSSGSLWARLILGGEGPSYHPVFANITTIGISTEISIRDIRKNRTIRRITNASDEWWTTATSWIEVFSGQDIKQLGPARALWRSGNRLQILPLTELERLESLFAVAKPDVSGIVNLKRLRASFAQASDGALPPDEWLFIRDARSLYGAGEYRRAVIDVGSAAEVAITTLIRDKLARRGMSQSDISTAIARAATKTLGGKRTFYESELQLGRLPPRFQSLVIDVRNDAVHLNREIRKVDAKRAIAAGERLVTRVSPLAAFIPSS